MPTNNLQNSPAADLPATTSCENHSPPGLPCDLASRLLLNDLQLPAELRQIVDSRCRQAGGRSKRAREHFEREIKFQHFFGGQDLAYLETARGIEIVAVGDLSSAAFSQALEALDATERRGVTLYSPDPWDGSVSSVLTPSSHEV